MQPGKNRWNRLRPSHQRTKALYPEISPGYGDPPSRTLSQQYQRKTWKDLRLLPSSLGGRPGSEMDVARQPFKMNGESPNTELRVNAKARHV